jgi:hypothetical protein
LTLALLPLWVVELAGASRRPETTAPPTLTTLTVSLASVSELSTIAQRSMVNETERIWRAEGVELVWTGSTQPSAVRIVVLHGQRTTNSTRYGLALFDRARSEIVVMLNATQQVIREGRRPDDSGPTTRAEHALGLALGRVIAHEIGHYLLGNEHARSGLMRAVFDARTLVDPRASLEFALDEPGRNRLRERLRQDFQSPVVSAD